MRPKKTALGPKTIFARDSEEVQGDSSRSRSSLIMRKLTKVLVLAAAFTALFALTALAKTGWASDENGWYYVGTDGERVTEETKNSNGKVYYLGEDGYMVKDFAVRLGDEDKLYYFGADGARVANQWVLLPEDEGVESGETERWYRFGSNGAAITNKPYTKIEGKYYGFDADGKMLFGFVNADGEMINEAEDPILTCVRWYGDNNDGAMKTGWQQYTDGFVGLEKESAWFYFNTSTGVKYKNEKPYYLIGQKRYAFASNGVMLTGWSVASPCDDTDPDPTGSMKSFWNEDGTMKKSTWVYASRLNGNGDSAWYYLNGTGYASEAGNVRVLKSKYYVFNPDENDPYMLSGLTYLTKDNIKADDVKLATESDAGNTVKKPVASEWGKLKKKVADTDAEDLNLYFFSKEDNAGGGVNGWAVSGAVEVAFDDETVTLNFDKHTYRILQGKVGDYLYNFGQLQTAGDGYNLKYVANTDATDADVFFVDSKGKVVTKAGKFKDANGAYYVRKAAGDVVENKYFIADDEYAYKSLKNGVQSGDVKYASAATVAKYLAGSDADVDTWNKMVAGGVGKNADYFAGEMTKKINKLYE